MNNPPGGSDPQDSGDDQNPFKGTPFEQIFNMFGGAAGGFPANLAGAGAAGGFDMQSLFNQIQSMMRPPTDGEPINWEVALDLARRTAASAPDPTPLQKDKDQVADAVRLADHWLDDATHFPSGVRSTTAWSRAEWLVGTLDVWKVLITPVAEQATGSMAGALPEEAQAMAGPLLGMLSGAMGSMVASQVGSGLGALAGEVMTATDIGLPLGAEGVAALVPINLAGFAEGLDVSMDDVVLYFALREAAHQRLYAGVPWLRDHIVGAVRDYAAGVEIDTSSIEEQLRSLDFSDPTAIQEALTGSLLEPKKSPQQQAALERLEITLALVEGWVDEIVAQATETRMPAAAKLAESVRRRRASGGPAEATFATLVGLELRPRRLRDASTLWGSLRTRQGAEARDGVWMHPHLLPTAADLDDPLGFREGAEAPEALSEEEFDAELRELLDGPSSSDE